MSFPTASTEASFAYIPIAPLTESTLFPTVISPVFTTFTPSEIIP